MIFIKKHALTIIGIVVGAAAGYWYYTKIGCKTGTCPITSNPWLSVFYGALIGGTALNIFKN